MRFGSHGILPAAAAVLLFFPPALPAQKEGEGKARAPRRRIEEIENRYRRLGELDAELRKVMKILSTELPVKGRQFAQERSKKLREELFRLRRELQERIEGARADFPRDPRVCRFHADLMASRGRRREALESLAHTVAARPEDLQAGSLQARLLFQEGRFTEALAAVDRLRRARKEKHLLAVLKIGVLGDLGRWEEAEREAAAALAALEQEENPLGRSRLATRIGQLREHRGICREYATAWKRELALREKERKAGTNPRLALVTDRGRIVVELFAEAAPNTVANFIELTRKKFYDGTAFHREEPGFIIQGGDPNTKDSDPGNDGRGGPGYYIVDEFGHPDARKHFLGSLSMANQANKPDTNGSQFFITKHTTYHLNGRHTVFGRVIGGMDVLFRIRQGDKLRRLQILHLPEGEWEALKLPR